MKKFKFSKQSIMNIREAQKKAEEQNLLSAAGRVAYEQGELDKIDSELDKAWLTPFVDGMQISEFQMYKERYVNFLKSKRERQQLNLNNAEHDYDLTKDALHLALAECRKIEKLKEREHSLWCEEDRRNENKEGDEIALRSTYYAF